MQFTSRGKKGQNGSKKGLNAAPNFNSNWGSRFAIDEVFSLARRAGGPRPLIFSLIENKQAPFFLLFPLKAFLKLLPLEKFCTFKVQF